MIMTGQHQISDLEDKIRLGLFPIEVTQYALEKANYIARRINELAESPLEVAVFLIDDRSNSNGKAVIRDVYVAHDQQVTPIHFNISGYGKLLSKDDIRDRLNMRVVGLGHSHSLIANFHSPEDDTEIKGFFDTSFVRTKIETLTPVTNGPIDSITFERMGDSHNAVLLRIQGQDMYIHSRIFDATLYENLLKYGLRIYQKEHFEIIYAISLVFNARGDTPFCSIIYKADASKFLIKEAPIKVIPNGGKDISLDTIAIDMDLIQRVDILRRKYSLGQSLKSLIENEYLNFSDLKEAYFRRRDFIRSNPDSKEIINAADSLAGTLGNISDIYRRLLPRKNFLFCGYTDFFDELKRFYHCLIRDKELFANNLVDIESSISHNGHIINCLDRKTLRDYRSIINHISQIERYSQKNGLY